MKKHFMTLAAVLCCCLFTSCQKEGEDTTKEEPQDNTPASVELSFTFFATADMLSFADIVVTYNDGAEDKTETMSALTWSKSFKANLPATFKFERKVSVKGGYTFEDKAYSYTMDQLVEYKILTAKGVAVKSQRSGGEGFPTNLKGNKLEYVITQGDLDSSITYAFDKDGNCPQFK